VLRGEPEDSHRSPLRRGFDLVGSRLPPPLVGIQHQAMEVMQRVL